MTATRTMAGVRALDKQAYRTMMKDVNAFFVMDWHETLRPKHFTPEGARAYRYAPRKTKRITEGTVRLDHKKRPLAPNGNPLVWSGRSRALSRQRRIVATHKYARVVMPVRALNFKPGGIDMRAEFTVVTKEEFSKQEVKARQRQKRILRGLKASRKRTTKG